MDMPFQKTTCTLTLKNKENAKNALESDKKAQNIENGVVNTKKDDERTIQTFVGWKKFTGENTKKKDKGLILQITSFCD